MSTPTAVDHSDAVPNRFLDQGSGTDRRSHRCHTPATHRPSRACSLALHLGPAPGSQRSPHGRSPAHSHHSWSSCDLCSRLWLWPPHGRRGGHKRRLILPRPQCSLTWRVFFIDFGLCITPFPSTSLLFSTSGCGFYWLLAVYSLRITWDSRLQEAIHGVRLSLGTHALAKDDPQTPQEKRQMGQGAILANSEREHLDLCYTRRVNEANASLACRYTHSTPHQGKGPSKPV